MSITPQMDIFTAAQTSGTFVRNLTSILSAHNIHLQAVFAFEALGTTLYVPAVTAGRAILVLGGTQDSRALELKTFWGYRRDDIPAYLRKSSGCVRSFLLYAALKGVCYDEERVAEIMCQMLSSSGLDDRFPVAAAQLVKLLRVLEPRTRVFQEDVACASMQLLSMVASIPDDEQRDFVGASVQLPASTMGNLLVHAFGSVRASERDLQKRSVELCGATGFFDIATILLWLAPEKIAISLRGSNGHPRYRTVEFGDVERPLLIQIGSDSFDYDDMGRPTSGWKKMPWASAETVALNALSWVSLARPLIPGHGGLLSSVAIAAARKLIG